MELETWHSARQEDPTRSSLLTDEPHNEVQLPPVDGGKDAWLFLAAGFMMEALVWGMSFNHIHLYDHYLTARPGFSFAYGIFQDFYTTHEPFKSSGNPAVIGTCMMVR